MFSRNQVIFLAKSSDFLKKSDDFLRKSTDFLKKSDDFLQKSFDFRQISFRKLLLLLTTAKWALPAETLAKKLRNGPSETLIS